MTRLLLLAGFLELSLWSRVAHGAVSRLSCEALGWGFWGDDLLVCGERRILPSGCAPSQDYNSAKELCETFGARLCTLGELSTDAANAGGASGICASSDGTRAWAADEGQCGDGTGMTVGDSRQDASFENPPLCSPLALYMDVRCCADSTPVCAANECSSDETGGQNECRAVVGGGGHYCVCSAEGWSSAADGESCLGELIFALMTLLLVTLSVPSLT